MYEINKKKEPVYKNIWLRTIDASVIGADRKTFTFNNIPIIQVRNNTILKVNSVTFYGDGVNHANDHNWTIKLDRIAYKKNYYFNSDRNNIPTIATINYDTKNSVQNGLMSLHLDNQDINEIVLFVESDDLHGLSKQSQNIDIDVCLVLCEYDE